MIEGHAFGFGSGGQAQHLKITFIFEAQILRNTERKLGIASVYIVVGIKSSDAWEQVIMLSHHQGVCIPDSLWF